MDRNNKFDYLRHPQKGRVIKIKRGFSWTVAFFGPIALAIRGEWLVCGISILIVLLLTFIPIYIPSAVAIGAWAGYGAVANEQLLKQRLKQGWELIDESF